MTIIFYFHLFLFFISKYKYFIIYIQKIIVLLIYKNYKSNNKIFNFKIKLYIQMI